MAEFKNPTTVVSLNVRGLQFGGDRFKIRIVPLYEYVKNHPVSEVHLQEVFTYGMLRQLVSGMPQFRGIVFKKGLVGPMGGLVSFYREPPMRSKFYSLPPSPLAQLDPFRVVPYVHKALLVTHLPHGRMRCNLHLDPNNSGDWSSSGAKTSLIAKQLRQVAAIIKDTIQRERVLEALILGDFNSPPTTQAFKDFMQATGLTDVFEGNSRPTYHAFFLPEGRAPHQIDHMLFWSSLGTSVLMQAHHIFTDPVRHDDRNVYVSDHVGLAVDVVANV